MRVTISKRAAKYLSGRGGRLYVWARPFGGRGEAAIMRWATVAPADAVAFDRLEGVVTGVWVDVERGLELGDSLRIRRRLFLPWSLVLHWDNEISVVSGG